MKQFTQSLLFTLALLVSSANICAQTYHEGAWYSLYQSEFVLETKVSSFNGVNIEFDVVSPTAGTLQFDYIYEIWGAGLGGLSKKQETHIYESSNGGADWTELTTVNGKETSLMSATVNTSAQINKIKFDRPVGNTNTVRYTNVRMPLAYHILLSNGTNTQTLSFEPNAIQQASAAQTIALQSFYAAGDITITCQHPDVFRIGSSDNTSATTWTVGPNACASQNGQDGAMAAGEVLGDIDMYNLTIYFCPQHAIDYTDTIVISDGISSATIAVSGKGLPLGQTINWPFTNTQMTVDETITLNATASSGLEVTYTITEGQDVVAIEGNNLVAKKAGTATITATQAGNTDYLAAEPVAHTITVEKATPLITELPTIAPVTYGTTLDEALVLNGGKASVEGTFNITKPAAEELTQVWDAGEYTINITFMPTLAEAYNAVEATVTLTITQATQAINWTLDATSLFVNATLPLNATASSGLEVTYTITEGQDVVAIEGNNLVAKKAGTATITASQAGNNNYLAAETVAHTITVEKATPLITELPTIAPVTYGTTLAEALVLNGGKASVEGTFAITKPTAEEMTQVWDAGQYTINIVFTPALADAYNAVEATTKLLIEQATQTIAWTIDTNTLLVNETLPLNATASSGLEVTYTITEGQDVIAIEGNNLVAKKAGTATITALQTGNNNYLAAESITYTIIVEKATQTITWIIDATTLLVNETLPLNATASSGLEVTYTITEGQDVVAIEGNNLVAKKAGTATITASQAGNTDYLAAESVAHTITVEKATPQITELPTIAPVTYGTTLAEALILNGGKASVDGTFAIAIPSHEDYLQQVWDAGKHTIGIIFYPTQEEAYHSIDTTIVLLIEQAAQTITWTLDSTNLFVNDTLILTAAASSELEITYEVTGDEGVVTIEDNLLIAIQTGTITITASQTGNNNYLAAESVAYTLTIEDMPSAIIDIHINSHHTKKIIHGEKIYILHNGVYYDILGNTIK